MNLIVPFGSSILGAIIGGVFLLGGQQWNNRLTCQNNAKVVFTAFHREALCLDAVIHNQLLKGGVPTIDVVQIDVNTDIYHDAEKFLVACMDVTTIYFIYSKVADIDSKQKSIIYSSTGPDIGVSYEYLRSIQSSLIEILDVLKPYAYKKSMFFYPKHYTEINRIEQAIQNLKGTLSSFTDRIGSFRFILTHPRRAMKDLLPDPRL